MHLLLCNYVKPLIDFSICPRDIYQIMLLQFQFDPYKITFYSQIIYDAHY